MTLIYKSIVLQVFCCYKGIYSDSCTVFLLIGAQYADKKVKINPASFSLDSDTYNGV